MRLPSPSLSWSLLLALSTLTGAAAVTLSGCKDGGGDDDDSAVSDDDSASEDDDTSDDDTTPADDDSSSVPLEPPGYSGTNGFSILFDDGTLLTKDGVVTAWVNSYGQLDLRLGIADDLEVDIKGPAADLTGDVAWTSNQNDGMQVIVVLGINSGLQKTFGTTLLHPSGSSDTVGTASWTDAPEASGHGTGTFEGILKSLDGLHQAALSGAFDTDLEAH